MTLKDAGSWLRRPRYGLVHFLVFGVIVIGFAVWQTKAHQAYMATITFQSPLPAVRLAEQAWVSDDVAYRHRYDFTSDWFSPDIPVWQKAMEPYRGKPRVHYLEIGAYEGRSAVWMLEHVLTDPTSRATVIDLFDGPFEARYRANIEKTGAAERVTTIKGFSQIAARSLPMNSFDVIYIDGSHSQDDVLEDAVACWRLLKPGGILIFDDYWYAGEHEASNPADSPGDFPKVAIDAFCQCFRRQLTVIHNGYQLIARKDPVRTI
jgi:hypothetical protein